MTKIKPGFAEKLQMTLSRASSGVKLTEEEKSTVTDFFKVVASGKAGDYFTADEFQSFLGQANDLRSTPEMQKLWKENASARNADRFTKRYKPFFNLLLQGADIASALNQISTANAASRSLKRPGIPQPSGIDPALSGEISKLQQPNFDVERALAPAQQEIALSRKMREQAARATTGGQGAAYQSQVNKAAIDAARAGTALSGAADQVNRARQAQLLSAIGMRQGAAQTADQLRLQGANLATSIYNTDANNIANLGVIGRENLRNAVSTLGDNLLGGVGRMLPVADPYATATGTAQSADVPADPDIPAEYQSYKTLLDNNYRNTINNISSAFKYRPAPFYTKYGTPMNNYGL